MSKWIAHSQGVCAHNLPDQSVNLKAGSQEDTIWLIVAPKMAETMIVGLSWLKKWNSSVDWGRNKWCLRSKAEKVGCVEKPLKVKWIMSAEKVRIEPISAKQTKSHIPEEYRDLVEIASRSRTCSPLISLGLHNRITA